MIGVGPLRRVIDDFSRDSVIQLIWSQFEIKDVFLSMASGCENIRVM